MIRALRSWGTDDLEQESTATAPTETQVVPPAPPAWLAGAVVAVAAVARLVYLFGFATLENAGEGHTDAYHHWTVGYFTQQIGLSHGPRLWDLKGLEYFWGPLHPLLLSFLFSFGNHDIVVSRLLSTAAGVGCVLLIFLLVHRYFGTGAALGAAAFAALSPLAVFSDTAGLIDPFGAGLCLLGIWLAARRPFLAGLALALAATARAEAWVLGPFIVLLIYGARPSFAGPGSVLRGWFAGIALYLLFLWVQTGNPIYPFYWNYLTSVTGRVSPLPPSADQVALRPWFGVAALFLGLGMAYSVWRRPAALPLVGYAMGFGLVICIPYAFTSHMPAWDGWVWKDRFIIYALELVVASGLGATALLAQRHRNLVPLSAGVALVLAAQLLWPPLQSIYHATDADYSYALAAGVKLGQASRAVGGGVVMVPDDRPTVTYTLVTSGGVPAAAIQSQHYDPLFYLPPGSAPRRDPSRMAVVWRCWLQASHTRLLVVDTTHPDYAALIRDHPDWFAEVGNVPNYSWLFEAVHPPPSPTAGECAAAAALS